MYILNNYRLKEYLLFFFCILITVVFSAQSENEDIIIVMTPDNDMLPCGVNDGQESVHVVAKTNLTDIEFAFQLPIGVTYVPGSVTAGVIEINISDLSQPVFGYESLVTFEELDFTFTRTVACEAVQIATEGGTFQDTYSVSYTGGIESPLIENDPFAYGINYATLVIGTIDNYTVNVGEQIVDREITVTQGGLACVNTFTHFVAINPEDVSNYVLKHNGVGLTPDMNSTIDTLYYTINFSEAPFTTVGDQDDCFENGESIVFLESFDISGCTQSATIHNAFWGCFPGEHCQDATPQTGVQLFGTEVPDISLSYAPGSNYGLSFCGPKTFEIVVENNNVLPGGSATDVLVNIGLGHNSSPLTNHEMNPFWHYANMPGNGGGLEYRHITNITINGIPTNDTIQWSSSLYGVDDKSILLIKDLLTEDPDGPGVGLEDIDDDGFYDDLIEGGSFTFGYDIELQDIPSQCDDSPYSQFINWQHCYNDVAYLDQCKSQRPTKRIDVSYQNMISQYNVTNLLTAPSDIIDGEEFFVSIIPKLYVGPICDDAAKKVKVSIELPPGVVWTGEQAAFNEDNFVSGIADTLFMVGNNLVYEIDQIHGYSQFFKFPLVLDCGSYNGDTLAIPVIAAFECGNGCFSRDYYCSTFPVITPHCIGPCNGPVPLSMDAHRTSLGWTDNTMTELVDSDLLPETELDNYLAKDTMEIDTQILIADTSLTNLWTDIQYNASINSNNVFDYVSGVYTSYDASSGITNSGIITIMPTLTFNSEDETYNYRFDISESAPGGVLEANDTVWFTPKFVVRDDIPAGQALIFSDFKYIPFNILPNEEELSCSSWGDQAKVLKSNNFLSSWWGEQIMTSCSPRELGVGSIRIWDHIEDLFPSEYRPPLQFESFSVNLPDELIFLGSVTFRGFTGTLDDPTGDLLVSLDELTNTVSFIPNPAGEYRDPDQGGNQTNIVYVSVIAECGLNDDLEVGSAFYSDLQFQEYAYSTSMEEVVYEEFTNSNFVVYFNSPSFLLQSPFFVNDGTSQVVDWDVVVSNTSDGAMPYNWLRIQNLPGIEITDIQFMSDSTSVVYSENDGYTYAEIGEVAPGDANIVTIRIFATINTCGTQFFDVAQGWGCLGYPEDYSTISEASCYSDPITLGIEPINAEIQLDIISNTVTPVSMCEPFEIELEVNSSDAADINNPYITFTIPGGPDGLSIPDNTVSVEYPYNSGDFQDVSVVFEGDEGTINLMDHSVIQEIGGIYGVANNNGLDGRRARVIFNAQTECSFLGNTTLDFITHGVKPCGDYALGNGAVTPSIPITIDGAVVNYEFINEIIPPNEGVVGCGRYYFL